MLERGGRSSYPVRLASFQAMVKLLSGMSPRIAAAQSESERYAAGDFALFDAEVLPADAAVEATAETPVAVPASIFRACDIRGVAGHTLTPSIARQIGRAIGSEAFDHGHRPVLLARDGRLSSPEIHAAVAAGLQQAGREVVDIGQVPTPLMHFAIHHLGIACGVVVTAGHNPPNCNGLKVAIDGEPLHGQAIQALYQRLEKGDLHTGQGQLRREDVSAAYIDRVRSDIQLAQPFKVVVDCANGVAGLIAPALYRAIGCEVIELYANVDGQFPNHFPDPGDPLNMAALRDAVLKSGADLGLAFSGDGARLGVIDSAGQIIWPDRLLMLFARDLLTRHPDAEVIFDVKCSRHLAEVIQAGGGRATMWKSGYSTQRAKMHEAGALLAGEMSGHFFFAERWFGFDDALYAGARLLELLGNLELQSEQVFAALPASPATPELLIPVPEGAQHSLAEMLVSQAQFGDAVVNTVDGLRVEFGNGWGLVRASHSGPNLSARFEADSEADLQVIQARFRDLLHTVEPNLKPPF
jgi:phosphomannomutase/phosphoglucomutase